MLKEKLINLLKLDGLLSNLTGYVETRLEILKLEVKEDLAKHLAQASVILTLAVAFVFFVLFISLALAYQLGQYVGIFGGLAIVAGFYIFITLALVVFRKTIANKLEKKLLGLLSKKEK